MSSQVIKHPPTLGLRTVLYLTINYIKENNPYKQKKIFSHSPFGKKKKGTHHALLMTLKIFNINLQ